MPVVIGKPGSWRIRGRMRAQLVEANAKCAELIAANAKTQIPHPGPPFMSPAQLSIVQTAELTFQQLLAARN